MGVERDFEIGSVKRECGWKSVPVVVFELFVLAKRWWHKVFKRL
jgi:hypothetical protein